MSEPDLGEWSTLGPSRFLSVKGSNTHSAGGSVGHRADLKYFGETKNFPLPGFEPQTIQRVASYRTADRIPRKFIGHCIEQCRANNVIGNMHFYVERHWTGHVWKPKVTKLMEINQINGNVGELKPNHTVLLSVRIKGRHKH